MNKIYKVIYSKVRHCYVVVSEIARNQGKAHSSHTSLAGGTCVLALTLGLLLGAPGPVQADSVNLDNEASAYYDTKGNLTIGDKQTVAEGKNQKGEHNTTIGTQTDTLRNVTEGDTEGQPLDDASNTVLVDGEGKAHDLTKSTEAGGSTAVGYQNKAEGDDSTAIGNNAKITNKPVTYYVDADGKKTASADNAAWYKNASGNPTNVPQVFRDADGNTTATPQYVHTYTEKDPDTKEDVTKTEITSDATKADKDSGGNPVYNYRKEDNTDKLYSVILYQAASNSIAAGTNVTANGSNAVAVGYGSTADNSAVAIGDTAKAKENAVAMGKDTKAMAEGSIALGKGSEADRDGGVAGWDPKTGTASTKSDVAWKSGEGALSIGNGGASRQITNVAAGSEDSDAVNLAQLKNAMTHYYSVKTTAETDGKGNNNYLNDGATGDNALAAGVSAVATGDNATAVGTNTYASGMNASAYGYRAVASGLNSVAIGSGTSAQQEGSVAIGGHTQGSHAVQVGTDSTAESAYSVAVGGYAKGDHSVEVGHGSTAQGSYSTSIGGHAIGKNSIAIGSEMQGKYSNPASAGGDNSIAIGGHTNSINDIAIGAGSSTNGGKGGQAIAVGGSATGEQAVSIGGVATNSSATAVGRNSSATGSQSTAVGGHAGNMYSTAVGQEANASNDYATAVGNNSTASGDHSTALGYGTTAQGSNTTAIGGANARGQNVTAIGKSSNVGGDRDDSVTDATAIGGAHISVSDAVAIGSNATVNGQYGVALGYNSNVSYQSTGVGTGTKASNTGTAVGYGAQSSGYQSAAVGASSNAAGQNAVSLGGGGAWGDYSIALGSGAGTNAHAIALGQNSGAWGENAIAIGEGTNAWRANSIVLGKNSKSGADKNIEGYDPRTGVASVDDTSTWYSTDEAVSIGRAEERDDEDNITVSAITRQLNNLAAGTLDTDAVNVAQLKAATQKVNMHDYSVWSPDTETDTNYTNGGAIAKNSMAAGVSASTTKDAENAVAIGYGAQAEGKGATVIGQYGKATGRYALAFGGQQTDTTAEQADNVASGDNALSFGERTTASGTNATAFGQETKALEKRATAFGQRTQATQSNATAFGIDTTASGQNATAFGNLTQATAIGATAFGNKNQATGQYATAWGGGDKVISNEDGTTTKIGTVASGTYATAFGERTIASGESATAFGSDSTASGKNSLAFGENSTAAAENSLAALGGTVAESATNAAAIGKNAQATLEDSVALGSGAVADRKSGAKGYDMLTKGDTTNTTAAWVSNANAIAVGNGSTLTRQITGVAAGSQDTDAVNVAQLKAAGFKVTTQNNGSISSAILNGDTLDFEAKDNAIVSTSKDSKTITVAVSKTPTFDSAVFYNPNPSAGQNNEKVTISNGQVTAGTAQIGSSPADTLKLTENGKETEKTAPAGSYVTGLSNKEWNTTNPSYVSGRAATEDQLAKVSEAIGNATTAAGKRTVVTVNDKSNPAEATPNATAGAYGDYDSNGGNLMIAAKKDSDGVLTYNIKLNDQLAIGQKGEPGVAGKDGKDGKVTVETKGGTTVVIGHDGEPGKDGKDGLFVTGKDGADGKSGVSITGPNGAVGTDGVDGKVGIAGKDGKDAVSIAGKDGVGHIGLTGPKGEKGKDGISIDITTDLKSATLDDGKNVKTVIKDKEGKETTIEQAPRIQYQSDGKNYEVATLDDGLKFVGNDGKEVTRKLNSTLSLTGGITDGDALKNASSKNLGVRSNKDGDGLEIVMTDTPDFTKVTVGEGDDTTKKITIGKQTVTGKKSDGSTADQPQTGNYITGLDNKAWDKDNVVENRAATEGQLRDVAGSITNQANGGGFALTSDEKGDDKIVKQDLGKAIQIKGDTTYKADGSVEKAGNIKTSIDNGAIKVELNKDVDLSKNGSIKAGETTVNKDGVDTNKVTIKDSSISITKDGINGGSKQITNVASGASEIIKGEDGKDVYKYDNDTNAANIGDVKQLAQQEAQASAARNGKNITVKDDHTVNLNDHITLGDDKDKARQVDIDGTGAKVTAGDGANKVTVDGSNGQVVIGTGDRAMTLGKQANTAGDSNPENGNYLNGLDNRNWDGEHIQNGRAATEDQLKTVSDKVKSGRVFQGDDGHNVTVGLGDTLKIQGGARDVSSDNNIGIFKGADDTLQVRLAKDLTGLNSVTTGNTTINNGGLTIKTGDANRTITVQDGNVNMGGNTISGVAPGKVSPDSTEAVNGSQLYARDQAIGKLGNTVNHLDDKINRAGAGAAALAALHPQDFDPDDKWDFAAGYGNYHGASAAAIGAFYRPTEDVMVSVGGSMGGGENMVNAGVTFKLGQHNHVSNSRVAMAKEIRDLKATVGQLTQMVNQLTGNGSGRTLPLRKGDTLFPDVPKNHWAYDYVTKLAQAGILEGYPDGEFKGNRMMTRYEFATLVYRAIMGGAAANPKLNQGGTLDRLVDEFGDELQYIRIVVIDRDKDGKPTIERVRTVEDDRKHHHGKEREQQPLEQGL